MEGEISATILEKVLMDYSTIFDRVRTRTSGNREDLLIVLKDEIPPEVYSEWGPIGAGFYYTEYCMRREANNA